MGLGVRSSHHDLLLAMFLQRSIENLEPNSLDQALYRGSTQNSMNPEEEGEEEGEEGEEEG